MNANGDVSSQSTGYQIAIDTLTYLRKEVSKQVFYEVPFADYVPVAVGEGAFAQNILTNLSFSNSGTFASGIIGSGGGNERLATATASVASKSKPVVNWAKQAGYSIFDVEQALMANNWDFIQAQHEARKENWDLGLQAVSFLGLASDTRVTGLLNNADCTINTALITAPISGLNAADFATFVRTLISTYFTATNSTRMPTHFAIPYTDYLGLQVQLPGTAGTLNVSMMEYLEKALKAATQNPNFTIYPLAYCDAVNNTGYGINKQTYCLYNKDPRSLLMDIPVDYTVTQPNSTNNFQFQDVAYGQFSGVGVLRNLEVLYFRY
jgi:hypothetical protein